MAADRKDVLLCAEKHKDKLPKQLLTILLTQFGFFAWEMDVKKGLIYPNEAVIDLFGEADSPINVSDDLFLRDFCHRDDVVDFCLMHERLRAGESNICCKGRLKLKSGEYRWAKVRYILFFDDEKKPYWAVGCYEDITVDKEIQLRCKQLEIYRSAFTADAVIAYEADLEDDIILAFDKGSTGTNAIAGFPFDAFIHEVAEKFVHPDFKRGFCETFSRSSLCSAFHSGKEEIVFEFISNENDAKYRWLHETVRLIRHPETHHICGFFHIKNIDKEKNEEIELRDIAKRDPLTNLYNRITLERTVRDYIQRDYHNERNAALIMLDIDHFKNVNDTYGHFFGDAVLCMYAEKIKEIFRFDDMVSRLGGDEFVVFLTDIPSKEFAMKAAQKLCLAFRSWRTEGTYHFESSCSVGVAMYPLHGRDFASLYKSADEAQYHAKKNGKNHSCMYGTY